MSELKIYFPTGKFAKLFGISKNPFLLWWNRALQTWKILPNGYRLYSNTQIELLNAIYTLKDVGMNLKEIKKFIDKRNPKDIINILNFEIDELEKEITRLELKNKAF